MRIHVEVTHHVHVHGGGDLAKVLAGLTALQGAQSKLEKEIHTMGTKTQAAVAALVTEVADSKGKLASLRAAVLGFPALVAAAVADALANVDVDDASQAAAIDAARTEISDAVDDALAASETNPLPGEDTGGDTTTDTVGGGTDGDTLGGGDGGDTVGAGGGEDTLGGGDGEDTTGSGGGSDTIV